MKRTYKKRALFDFRRIGQFAFMLFVVFIAYKILTPPSNETVRTVSPDGSRIARLKTEFYFDGQPSYSVFYREQGKKVWLKIHSLPAFTNAPPETHQPDLQWSENSERIDFLMNGTSIWHHSFAE